MPINFAFAAKPAATQKGWAFQASSPKTFKAAPFGRLFFDSCVPRSFDASSRGLGRQAGQFTWRHSIDTDNEGNIYATEVNTGRRVQTFVFTKLD